MPTPDELKVIFENLAGRTPTDEEIGALMACLKGNQAITVQFAKQINNVNEAQNSQFGDRFDVTSNDEALQALIRTIQQMCGQPDSPPTLSPEAQQEAICRFLKDIENLLRSIPLFHTWQPIALQDQYIPIQVTLERCYHHEIETTWSYTESEDDLKRSYVLKGGEENTQRQQVDWKTAKAEYKRIIVLADPGMGKSTLLQLEALSTAQQARQGLENGQELEAIKLPLYLRLSDLADSPKDEEFLESIPRLILRDYPTTTPDVLPLLREKLKAGQCLLLLDALDEVPKDKRIALSKKLNRFAHYYNCQIIVTSRIVGYYGKAFVDKAKEVEIVPFNQQQTEQYIHKWFERAVGHPNEELGSVAELIRELRNKPQIRGLAQNPLLLSLFCSMCEEKGLTLPTRRCQVYKQAVEYMLGKWSRNRKPQSEARLKAKQRLLEKLAYDFSCKSRDIFSSDELYDWIEAYLQTESVPTVFGNVDTDALMTELTEEDGILLYVHEEGKQYLFGHRTFQEYLTASYLKRSIETNKSSGVFLVREYFQEYEWHETLRLLAGILKDPIPLLQAITTEKDDIFYSFLLLAGQCIAECENNSSSLIQEILEKIYKLWCSRPSVSFFNITVVTLARANNLMLEKLLRRALQDRCKEVRRGAVQILGEIATSEVTAFLIQAIKDCDIYVRIWSVLALGRIGNAQAIQALIQALYEQNGNIKKWVVLALKKSDNSQLIIQCLIDEILHLNDNVRNKILLYFPEYVKINIRGKQFNFFLKNLKRNGSLQVIAIAIIFKFIQNFLIKEVILLLGEIGDFQAIEGLIRILQPLNSDIRRWVAAALATMKDLQVVEALVQAAHDSQDDLENDFQIPGSPTQSLNLDDSELSRRIVAELEQIDSLEVADAVFQKLYPCCKEVRREAAIALGKIGNPLAVEILSQTLSDPDNEIRREAAIALGKIGNQQAMEILSQTLNNLYSNVRREAIIALGVGDTPNALALLAQFLNDQDGDIRWRAAAALGEIGSSQAVEILIKALHHLDGDVRREAATALGEIGSLQAVEALIHHFNHKKNNDNEDRRWVAAALGKVKWTALGLSKLRNTQILESLIPALDDSDSYVRRWIAVAIGRISDALAVEALIGALSDRDRNVRKHVAIALGRISDALAVEALIGTLKDRDNKVREQAILALGKIGDPGATQALIQALTSSENYFRMWAAAVLVKMLWSINAIVQTFKKIRRPKMLPLLDITAHNCLDEHIEYRGYTVKSLAQALICSSKNFRVLPPVTSKKTSELQAFSAIVRALDPPDSSIRCRAATALGEIGDKRAVKALVQALLDPSSDVRGRATAALGKIGEPQALESLIQALSHPDKEVKKEAIAALEQFGTSEVLKRLVQSPEIDIYDSNIYTLARTLAIRASMTKQSNRFVPIYTKKVRVIHLIFIICQQIARTFSLA